MNNQQSSSALADGEKDVRPFDFLKLLQAINRNIAAGLLGVDLTPEQREERAKLAAQPSR